MENDGVFPSYVHGSHAQEKSEEKTLEQLRYEVIDLLDRKYGPLYAYGWLISAYAKGPMSFDTKRFHLQEYINTLKALPDYIEEKE